MLAHYAIAMGKAHSSAWVIRFRSIWMEETKREVLVAMPAGINLFKITGNREGSEKPGCEFLDSHLAILGLAVGLVKE